MYSIKPGRGPSAFGAVGGVFAAIFGVIWIFAAASMGAPGVFVLFGMVFVLFAIAGVVFNFLNATQRNRMSTFDITEASEEPDPIARSLGYGPRGKRPASRRTRSVGRAQLRQKPPVKRQPPEPTGAKRRFDGDFCPYCGKRVERDYDFCPGCGKDV